MICDIYVSFFFLLLIWLLRSSVVVGIYEEP